jgi:hypothetical protein
MFQRGYLPPADSTSSSQCRVFNFDRAIELALGFKEYNDLVSLFQVYPVENGQMMLIDGINRLFSLLYSIMMGRDGYSMEMQVRVLIHKAPEVFA